MKNFIANVVFYAGHYITVLGEKLTLLGFALHKRFKTEAGIKIIEMEDTLKSMVGKMTAGTSAPKLNLPSSQNEANPPTVPKPFFIKTPGNS